MSNNQNIFAVPDLKMISWYKQLSVENKLQWLESSAQFYSQSMDAQTKKIAEILSQKKALG